MNPSTSFRSALFCLLLILSAGFLPGAPAAPGDLDLSFDPGSGINGGIYAMARQPDGKIVIGGDFGTVKGLERPSIARLNPDGSGDPTFLPLGPNTGIASVAAVVFQADGKILIGYQSGIARLHADGTPDTTFDQPRVRDSNLFGSGVSAIALQPDGKILIGGSFSIVNENLRSCIARLNADGTLDDSFQPGGGVIGDFRGVSTIAQQVDGKIFIAGLFAGYHETFRPNLARLNTDGSLDETFDANLPNEGAVARIAIQPDGKVLFGGAFSTVNGTSRRSIARVHADGSLDIGFDPGTGLDGGSVTAMALQPDGRVHIGGVFNTVNGTPRKGIARLNLNGSLDATFEPPSGDRLEPTAFAMEPDGKLLVAGFDMVGTRSKHDAVIRLHPNGSRDVSFDAGGGLEGFVRSIAVQPNGKAIVGGGFRYVDGVVARGVARLHADGSRDGSFNLDPEADGYFYTAALLPDGRVLVGGGPNSFNHVNNTHGGIARVHADGSLDSTFDPGTGLDGGSLYVIVGQSDGKVVVGGSFDTVNGVECKNVARLNADGSVDTNFNVNMVSAGGDVIRAVAAQSDGKVLIGGPVVFPGEERRYALARVQADGSRDESFTFAMVGSVASIAIQADGKVIIGGRFSPDEAEPHPLPLARLNGDGSLDTSFHPLRAFSDGESSPGVVSAVSVVVQADGKVLVGGDYYLGHDEAGNDRYFLGIYRLNADGLLDSTFDPGTSPNRAVSTIALQPDGQVLVGGGFLTFGNFLRPSIARVFTSVPAAPEVAVEQPAGSVLVDGAAIVSYGSIAPGGTVDRVFTVKNAGTAELSDLVVSIEGTHASSFTVTAAPAEAVAAGGSTTFTVRFAPVNRGLHSAMLHVASNDEDESPFDIGLTGSGANASPMAVADSASAVSGIAVEVDVLANDSDPEGDGLTITAASSPTNGTAEVVATSGGPRIRYTSVANYSGSDTFTYSISDGFGGSAAGTVTMQVSRPKGPKKISKGGAVAGAGDSSSGVPAGAIWKTFGVPSIASNGSIAFGATVATSEGIVPLVYVGSSEDVEADSGELLEYALAKKGDPAPGVAGATFAAFKDPLLNAEGTVVFMATLRGARAGANGGIWKHSGGDGPGVSTLVAQLGAEPAGVPGARWKAFTSVALSEGVAGEETIAFTATMVPGAGGVRAANDLGLWFADANGVTLALREGSTLAVSGATKKVKSFVALQAVPGAAGQGNGATASGVLARVKFTDGTHEVVRVSIGEDGLEITSLPRTGDPAGDLGVKFAAFGLPAQSPDGRAAFTATLTSRDRQSDTAIFQSSGSGIEVIAREGDQALAGDAAVFSSFTGLANDTAGRVAFTARLHGDGVSGANNAAVFLHDGEGLVIVARKGEQPPGVPPGAKWGSFLSVALPDGAGGPIFVAKFQGPPPGQPNPGRISSRNHTGVWAVDASGELRLIARTGDVFDAQRMITGLTLLSHVLGSPAQARSFTGAGDLIYRATLNDGSQHVVSVRLP